jgi:CHAT domain-containing protein/Tfp pilus assembly protein PilF
MRDEINGNGYGNKRHPDRNLMVGFLTGSCTEDTRIAIEEHCIDCLDCRIQLSTLLRLIISSEDREEHRKFSQLLSLGKEAAARARSTIMTQQELQRNHYSYFSAAAKRKKLRLPRLVLTPALIIILLLAGSLVGYFVSSHKSSDESMLARVREVYGNTRLIQARVTGGFTHHQYVETRDPGDPTEVNKSLRAALMSELDQEAFAHQRPGARHNLGRLFMLYGDMGPAEEQFLLALKERPRDARILTDLGALYYERSRKENKQESVLLHKAAEHLTNAIEIDTKIHEAWFNRALCYERMNLFLQAESDWKQYLTLDGDSGWAEEARAHLNELRERATRLEKREQNVPAEFQAAEAAGDELKLRELVTQHFVPVRNLAMNQIFDKYLAAAIAGDKNQADVYLKTLNQIGQLISEIKSDRLVIDAVNFAARGNPTVKKEIQAIRQTLQQASQEYGEGKIGAGYGLYAKARSAAERIGDYCHAEMAAFGLVQYYHHNDETPELNTLRSQLVKDTERRQHRQIQARALHALANAESAAQQLSLSLKHGQQVVEIARALGDTESAIAGLRFIGRVYSDLGENDSAASKLSEAGSLLRDVWIKPINAALTYNDIGYTLFQMGEYMTALPYQREAVQLCERSGNAMLLAFMIQRLGMTYGMLGRYEEAMRYLDDAVARAEAITDQVARVRLQVDIYTRLGEFYLQQKKLSQAIITYQRAIEKIGQGNSRFHLSSIHKGLAAAYLAQGKDSEAEAELEKSIRLSEEAREKINDAGSRDTFLATQQNVYRAMVNFQFFNKKDPARAFNYAEIAKGRALLDALAGPAVVSTNDSQVNLAISRSATPLTIDQVQRMLPPNTQLVQYVLGEKNLMIWLVTRDRLITAKADISADNLRSKVAVYLDELRKVGSLEGLNSQAAELYQWLIAPIGKQLDPNRELCIIPDGLLQDLPFASLVSPETKRYLIEDFALVINPSASVFARTVEISRGKQKSESESFLGIGNPSFNQQAFPKLSTLSRSEQEIERIRSFYPQHLILTRKQATESALAEQIGNYEIVHLATHALSNQQSSMLSTIFLAGESDSASEGQNPEQVASDGALRAHEIYRLKPRRTRLVVLSSCRSALGDRSRNEAIGGLAQAFLVAGVPTVIASLWNIDDESAARLMERFHATHRGKKLAFGEALRQTQISFLQTAPVRLRHPYFWATFIVTGDSLAGNTEPTLPASVALRADKR